MEIKKCYIAITPTSPGSTDKFHNIVHAFSQGNYFLAAAVVCTLLLAKKKKRTHVRVVKNVSESSRLLCHTMLTKMHQAIFYTASPQQHEIFATTLRHIYTVCVVQTTRELNMHVSKLMF